ncbi:MAG: ABC transporter substrate-binding protein, partial [Candidatus Woesearchaeota archaeon]|nr:ABC transporter substrate-binding protein [Candidatus Woesearchaeota archaeon]
MIIKKIMLTLLSLILLIGCTAQQAEKPVIKIGVIASLTGIGAYQGQQELKGLELAKEAINTRGGIKGRLIELQVEDSKTEPSSAVTVAQKLISMNVKGIIGDSWTSTTAVFVPVTNKAEMIVISPLATLDSLAQDDYFFRTMPNTQSMMNRLADYSYEQGIQTVGIIRQESPFGVEHAKDFQARFEGLGGNIIGEETADIKSTDLRTELLKIKEKNPDAILNLHATTLVGLVLKQGQEIGISARWISSFGAETSGLLNEYKEYAEGLTYVYPYDSRQESKASTEFRESYLTKYNEFPENTAANSYDALMLLATALEQGTDSQTIKQSLLS